jgi:hypothetical protein
MPVRSGSTMCRIDRRRSSLRRPRRPKYAPTVTEVIVDRCCHYPCCVSARGKNDPVTKNLRPPFPARSSELSPVELPQFHKDQPSFLPLSVDR